VPRGPSEGKHEWQCGGGEKGGRLRVVDVDAGHWIMLEKADETNRIWRGFWELWGVSGGLALGEGRYERSRMEVKLKFKEIFDFGLRKFQDTAP